MVFFASSDSNYLIYVPIEIRWGVCDIWVKPHPPLLNIRTKYYYQGWIQWMMERGGMQKYWMILHSISKYHYQGRVQCNVWWKGRDVVSKLVLQKIFQNITISREGYNRWWKGARCNVINYNHFPSSLNPPWEPNIMTFIYTQIYPNTLKYTQIHSNIPKYTQIYSKIPQIHSNIFKCTQI